MIFCYLSRKKNNHECSFMCIHGYEFQAFFSVIFLCFLFSFYRKNLASSAILVLTTCLTIVGFGLCGNNVSKSTREHRFWTKKHTKVVKKRYFTLKNRLGARNRKFRFCCSRLVAQRLLLRTCCSGLVAQDLLLRAL